MISLWLIIGIAAASAVSLTVSGVLIAVHIERRKNKKWMKETNIDRNLSHQHRPHLSITDLDFSSLPRPIHILGQGSQRPRIELSRFYASCPSQEDVKSFSEGNLMDPAVNPGHVSVESSYQWLSPTRKSRRKKKMPKFVVSGPPTMNRLSAVTELSEEARQGTPEPVELPTHRTPRVTPEKEGINCSRINIPIEERTHHSRCSTSTVRVVPSEKLAYNVNQQVNQDGAQRYRSTSIGSINSAPPPRFPLPELPDHPRDELLRTNALNRSISSDVGRHHREFSMSSSTSVKAQIDQFNRTSGLSRFEFGLSGSDTSPSKYKAYGPNLSIDTRSVSFHQSAQPELLRPKSSGKNTPSGEFQVIDASSWSIPRGLRHLVPASPSWDQRSPSGVDSQFTSDPRKSLTAPNSTSSSPLRFTDDLSRPSSVTSIDMFRLSVVGSPSSDPMRKGHKRQNCVRIKNLQPIEPKKRPNSHLGRLTEMEEDSSILLPSPAKKLVEEASKDKAAPISTTDRSPPISLRIKRPGLVASRNISGQSTKSVGQSETTITESSAIDETNISVRAIGTPIRPLQLAKKYPLEMSSRPDINFSPASQPFVFDAASPQRQKSKIQGPRNIPPTSIRVRNQTGSPIRRKSSASKQTTRQTSLRRAATSRNNAHANANTSRDSPEISTVESPSAISVRTLPSSDTWNPYAKEQRRRSSTVAGYGGEVSHRNIKSLGITESRLKAHMPGTPPPNRNHPSPSNISIWEDVSVCADSPDMNNPWGQFRQTQSSSRPVSSHHSSPIRSKQASKLIARFEGIENSQKLGSETHFSSDDNDSRLGTMKEGNRRRSRTTVMNNQPSEGIGLGLRFD